MPDTTVDDDLALCERLRHTVEGMHRALGGSRPAITVSIGLADTAGERAGFDALHAQADQALYAAERGGRNRVSVTRETPPGGDPGEGDHRGGDPP